MQAGGFSLGEFFDYPTLCAIQIRQYDMIDDDPSSNAMLACINWASGVGAVVGILLGLIYGDGGILLKIVNMVIYGIGGALAGAVISAPFAFAFAAAVTHQSYWMKGVAFAVGLVFGLGFIDLTLAGGQYFVHPVLTLALGWK